MRTIIEDQIVSEIIAREGAAYPRLEDAFEALKWWLSHNPDSGEPIDDLNWLFKQNGDFRYPSPGSDCDLYFRRALRRIEVHSR